MFYITLALLSPFSICEGGEKKRNYAARNLKKENKQTNTNIRETEKKNKERNETMENEREK